MSGYFGIPLRNGLPLGLGAVACLGVSSTPVWLSLVQQAEAAAAAAGASLWYVPPASYADRAINGPFVGSDGSGGNPAVGSGVVGWLADRAQGGRSSNNLLGVLGQFDSPAGWNIDDPTRANISGGSANFTGTGNIQVYSTSTTIYPSAGTYMVTGVVTNRTAGDLLIQTTGGSASVSTNGSFSRIVVSTGSSRAILTGIGGFNGSVDNVQIYLFPGNHATQSTSANRPVLVAAPGAAAAADGFAVLSYDGTDLLVAPLTSSGTPGYWDMQDDGTERTTPAAATTTTVTLQVPNTRRLLVAVAATGALPADLVTKARALANYIRGA